ncbi:MAG: hypothetical protein ACLQCU_15455 [Acidimicrobiales bacterium]
MSTWAQSGRALSCPWARRFLAEGFALMTLGALAVSGCGPTTAASPKSQVSSAVVRASLATSIETSAGSWAVVPMGHLDQPLNTFWQLLFRPAGASAWSDRASALAVATNGGLIVATRGGESLAVGIRSAAKLSYSPLIVTSDARSWFPADPVGALAEQPDALAIAAGGEALALVGEGRAAQVLVSPAALTSWRSLVSERALAASPPGRACGIVSLTAVGYSAGHRLIGASCRRDGVVGIFTEQDSAWRLVGPGLPQPFGHSSTEVLGLQTTTAGLCALVGITGRRSAQLVAACTRGSRLTWRVSPALLLAGPEGVVSFGPAGKVGLFALISGSAHPDTLAVLGESHMTWSTLRSPPARTATVVFAPAGRVDALVVDDTSFADWRLADGGRRWSKEQNLHVAIQFGSSG